MFGMIKKTFLNFAPSYVANYFYLLMIKYSIKAGKTLRNLFSESMSTMCTAVHVIISLSDSELRQNWFDSVSPIYKSDLGPNETEYCTYS